MNIRVIQNVIAAMTMAAVAVLLGLFLVGVYIGNYIVEHM